MTTTRPDPAPVESRDHRWRHRATIVLVTLAVVAVIVLLWNQGQQLIAGEVNSTAAYLTCVALVFGDALFPVLPGETTLNAASILAASGELDLVVVMICGAVGAIAGDSALYWLSRTSHGRVRHWLDSAGDSKAGSRVSSMLAEYGNVFLLFARYVPGLRFALNVTLGGVVRMPYPRFLFWSSISGATWSVWTCLAAYYISHALDGYPIAALIVSTFLGTALITGGVWLQRRFSTHHRPSTEVVEAV